MRQRGLGQQRRPDEVDAEKPLPPRSRHLLNWRVQRDSGSHQQAVEPAEPFAARADRPFTFGFLGDIGDDVDGAAPASDPVHRAHVGTGGAAEGGESRPDAGGGTHDKKPGTRQSEGVGWPWRNVWAGSHGCLRPVPGAGSPAAHSILTRSSARPGSGSRTTRVCAPGCSGNPAYSPRMSHTVWPRPGPSLVSTETATLGACAGFTVPAATATATTSCMQQRRAPPNAYAAK